MLMSGSHMTSVTGMQAKPPSNILTCWGNAASVNTPENPNVWHHSKTRLVQVADPNFWFTMSSIVENTASYVNASFTGVVYWKEFNDVE